MTTSTKDVSFKDFQDVSDLTPTTTANIQSTPPKKHDDERDKITDSVYEQLLSSICIDIACGTHKMVKTGKYSGEDSTSCYTDIMLPSNRRQVYSTIEDGHLLSHVEKIVPLLRENGTHTNKRKLGLLLDNGLPQDLNTPTRTNHSFANGECVNTIPGGDISNNNSTTDTGLGTTAISTTDPPSTPSSSGIQTRNSQADIWGRIPPKEPKTLAKCQLCGRSVSTLRFAPHLDKCMGIGTNTRAAAANHNSHPHQNKNLVSHNNKSGTPTFTGIAPMGSTPTASSLSSSHFSSVLPPPKTYSSMTTPNQQQNNMMMMMLNKNTQKGGNHMKSANGSRMMTF